MSKNYNRSDYALNKFSASLVYSAADGIYEITEQDFLASDPSLTEEDYERWKRFSDQSYLDIVRRDTFEGSHIVPIDDLAETVLVSQETTEDKVLEKWEPTPNPFSLENAVRIIKEARLTKIQARRYCKFYIKNMSNRDIAKAEGVRHRAVEKSIATAEKKIKKVLKNG